MVYFKMTDENGFVSVSTLDAETGGNSTKEEHDAIAQMYRDAEPGYGVVEAESSFAYALRPVPPEPELTDEEAEWANAYILDLADIVGEDPEPHLFAGGGVYLCDGFQATAYSRLRFVGNNDYERTERQRTVITGLLDKVRNMSVPQLGDLATKILPEMTHNISAGQVLGLILQLPSILRYDMDQDRVPYEGLYTSQNEILVPDMEETKRRLHETIYG
jgi:hypothetical protein